jgi:hypothetical protein
MPRAARELAITRTASCAAVVRAGTTDHARGMTRARASARTRPDGDRAEEVRMMSASLRQDAPDGDRAENGLTRFFARRRRYATTQGRAVRPRTYGARLYLLL